MSVTMPRKALGDITNTPPSLGQATGKVNEGKITPITGSKDASSAYRKSLSQRLPSLSPKTPLQFNLSHQGVPSPSVQLTPPECQAMLDAISSAVDATDERDGGRDIPGTFQGWLDHVGIKESISTVVKEQLQILYDRACESARLRSFMEAMKLAELEMAAHEADDTARQMDLLADENTYLCESKSSLMSDNKMLRQQLQEAQAQLEAQLHHQLLALEGQAGHAPSPDQLDHQPQEISSASLEDAYMKGVALLQQQQPQEEDQQSQESPLPPPHTLPAPFYGTEAQDSNAGAASRLNPPPATPDLIHNPVFVHTHTPAFTRALDLADSPASAGYGTPAQATRQGPGALHGWPMQTPGMEETESWMRSDGYAAAVPSPMDTPSLQDALAWVDGLLKTDPRPARDTTRNTARGKGFGSPCGPSHELTKSQIARAHHSADADTAVMDAAASSPSAATLPSKLTYNASAAPSPASSKPPTPSAAPAVAATPYPNTAAAAAAVAATPCPNTVAAPTPSPFPTTLSAVPATASPFLPFLPNLLSSGHSSSPPMHAAPVSLTASDQQQSTASGAAEAASQQLHKSAQQQREQEQLAPAATPPPSSGHARLTHGEENVGSAGTPLLAMPPFPSFPLPSATAQTAQEDEAPAQMAEPVPAPTQNTQPASPTVITESTQPISSPAPTTENTQPVSSPAFSEQPVGSLLAKLHTMFGITAESPQQELPESALATLRTMLGMSAESPSPQQGTQPGSPAVETLRTMLRMSAASSPAQQGQPDSSPQQPGSPAVQTAHTPSASDASHLFATPAADRASFHTAFMTPQTEGGQASFHTGASAFPPSAQAGRNSVNSKPASAGKAAAVAAAAAAVRASTNTGTKRGDDQREGAVPGRLANEGHRNTATTLFGSPTAAAPPSLLNGEVTEAAEPATPTSTTSSGQKSRTSRTPSGLVLNVAEGATPPAAVSPPFPAHRSPSGSLGKAAARVGNGAWALLGSDDEEQEGEGQGPSTPTLTPAAASAAAARINSSGGPPTGQLLPPSPPPASANATAEAKTPEAAQDFSSGHAVFDISYWFPDSTPPTGQLLPPLTPPPPRTANAAAGSHNVGYWYPESSPSPVRAGGVGGKVLLQAADSDRQIQAPRNLLLDALSSPPGPKATPPPPQPLNHTLAHENGFAIMQYQTPSPLSSQGGAGMYGKQAPVTHPMKPLACPWGIQQGCQSASPHLQHPPATPSLSSAEEPSSGIRFKPLCLDWCATPSSQSKDVPTAADPVRVLSVNSQPGTPCAEAQIADSSAEAEIADSCAPSPAQAIVLATVHSIHQEAAKNTAQQQQHFSSPIFEAVDEASSMPATPVPAESFFTGEAGCPPITPAAAMNLAAESAPSTPAAMAHAAEAESVHTTPAATAAASLSTGEVGCPPITPAAASAHTPQAGSAPTTPEAASVVVAEPCVASIASAEPYGSPARPTAAAMNAAEAGSEPTTPKAARINACAFAEADDYSMQHALSTITEMSGPECVTESPCVESNAVEEVSDAGVDCHSASSRDQQAASSRRWMRRMTEEQEKEVRRRAAALQIRISPYFRGSKARSRRATMESQE